MNSVRSSEFWVACAVPKLPGDGEPVLPVVLLSQGVAGGRCPVKEGYLVLAVLDAVSEDVDDPVVRYLPLQPV